MKNVLKLLARIAPVVVHTLAAAPIIIAAVRPIVAAARGKG